MSLDSIITQSPEGLFKVVSPTNGQSLVYNSSESRFVNDTISGGGGSGDAVSINGQLLASLTTGILKNTTSTGVPSIASAGDFPTLNQNTNGYAESLKSATTTVSVSASVAPTTGQVLTATSGTAATWQTPASGGSSGFETNFLLMGA